MSAENADIAASTAGSAAASAAPSVEVSVSDSNSTPTKESPGAAGGSTSAAATPESTAAPAAPAYTPNFKYKAALQEKELDEFWRPLVKDADSEKKVKELFTKVDAFDFIKSKKEETEKNLQSLAQDYQQVSSTVHKFNNSVKSGDLSSAFRLAGITKEQIFRWTQQQLALMEMPPEQRQQFEQFEQAQMQKSNLEEQVSMLQEQYQQQAVQARSMQLDVALAKPEVSQFSQAWDTHSGQPGSFRQFVIEEAQKAYYTTQQDLSPEQAIAMVMQRFGKFLNTGDTVAPTPQAASIQAAQQAKPVIPHVAGKAASPIKKVPRSLDDLRKLAKEMA
jgi:hypothetical protein